VDLFTKEDITEDTKQQEFIVKLNRRDLRRLIESVINEENPGSKFAAAEKKGEKNKSAVEKDIMEDIKK
jgi:hypothetical protein